MQVKLSKNALIIMNAITTLSLKRKEDETIYVNADSISKLTGITWKTVDRYLTNNFNIKEQHEIIKYY